MNKDGLVNRYLGLRSDDGKDGHNISGVKLNGKWIVADFDFGLVYPASIDILYEPEGIELIKEKLQERNFPQVMIDGLVKSRKGTHGLPHFDFPRGLFDRNHMFRATGFDFLRGYQFCCFKKKHITFTQLQPKRPA